MGLLFENGKVIVSQQTRKEGEFVRRNIQTEKKYNPNGDLISEKKVSNFLRTTNIDILTIQKNKENRKEILRGKPLYV